MSSFSHNVHRLLGLGLMERLGLEFDLDTDGDPSLSEDDSELLVKALAAFDEAFPFDGPEGVPSVPIVVHPVERANVLVPGEVSRFLVNEQGVVPEIWSGSSWRFEVGDFNRGDWSVIPGMVIYTARVGANTAQAVAPLRYRYSTDGDASYVEGVVEAGWAA